MKKKNTTPKYNDQSITMLKGAERVRKRPAVIFGSNGLEGCEHSVFEIVRFFPYGKSAFTRLFFRRKYSDSEH